MSDLFAAPKTRACTTDDALARIQGADLSLPGDFESAWIAACAQRGDLLALIAALDRAQAFRLRRRLERDRADDPIVAAFKRVATERRVKVLAVLADPGARMRLTGCRDAPGCL